MGKLIDLTGQRFGRLTVVERASDYITPKGKKEKRYKCKCDCGNETVARGSYLKNGTTNSCGCLCKAVNAARLTTHGHTKTRLYNIWNRMKQRCGNPNDVSYARYGGRGITVCEEWLGSFQAFYDWAMANGYQDDLSIDRIDNDRGYSPENCRWETVNGQCLNRRSNHIIELSGEAKPLSEWCKQYGLVYTKVIDRINRYGWSPEEALGLVPRRKK